MGMWACHPLSKMSSISRGSNPARHALMFSSHWATEEAPMMILSPNSRFIFEWKEHQRRAACATVMSCAAHRNFNLSTTSKIASFQYRSLYLRPQSVDTANRPTRKNENRKIEMYKRLWIWIWNHAKIKKKIKKMKD